MIIIKIKQKEVNKNENCNQPKVNYTDGTNPQNRIRQILEIAYSYDFRLSSELASMMNEYMDDAIEREVVIELTEYDFKRYLLDKTLRHVNPIQKARVSTDNVLEALAEIDEFVKEMETND